MLSFHILKDIDENVFDNLYTQSLPYLDNGTFPWDKLPFMTASEKKNHIRLLFELLRYTPRSVLWEVRKGELPLMLNIGYVFNTTLLWRLGLSGADENGSRSWLYHPSYRTARDAFWAELKVDGYKMSAVEGQSVHKHAEARQTIESLRSNTFIDGEVSPGVIDIKFAPVIT